MHLRACAPTSQTLHESPTQFPIQGCHHEDNIKAYRGFSGVGALSCAPSSVGRLLSPSRLFLLEPRILDWDVSVELPSLSLSGSSLMLTFVLSLPSVCVESAVTTSSVAATPPAANAFSQGHCCRWHLLLLEALMCLLRHFDFSLA